MNVSRRFHNMPTNSFITIVGQVKRRPNNLQNFVSDKLICWSFFFFVLLSTQKLNYFDSFLQSIPTGGVEVHVDSIVRVQKMFNKHESEANSKWLGKR